MANRENRDRYEIFLMFRNKQNGRIIIKASGIGMYLLIKQKYAVTLPICWMNKHMLTKMYPDLPNAALPNSE